LAGYPARARTGHTDIQPAKTKLSPNGTSKRQCISLVIYNYSALIFYVKRLFNFSLSNFFHESHMDAF